MRILSCGSVSFGQRELSKPLPPLLVLKARRRQPWRPGQPLPTLLPPPEGNKPAPPTPAPSFSVDDEVRVRNLHPRGHTRVPRYARGKRGTVLRDNGVWALQDTDENGQRLGNFPQHVYTVRFDSQELWGKRASPRDIVYIDLWEEYLEPA